MDPGFGTKPAAGQRQHKPSTTLPLANAPTQRPKWGRYYTDVVPSLESRLDRDRKASKTPLPTATITSLVDEPIFLTGYLSEEEPITDTEEEEDQAPSNMDARRLSSSSSDSVSLYDDVIIATDDFHATFPELLADDSGFVEQRCVHAEAIRFVSAGRPVVVDMAKASRNRTFRASQIILKRPAESPIRASYIRPTRKSVSSIKSDATSDAADRQSSTGSIPTTPTLEDDSDGATTPTSDTSPITPKSSFDRALNQAKKDLKNEMEESPTNTSIASRIRRPSRLRLFARRTSSSTKAADSEVSKTSAQPAAYVPQVYVPTGHKSAARGASERSPVIRLPPSPVTEEPLSRRPLPVRNSSLAGLDMNALAKGRRVRRMESFVGLNQR